MEAVYGKWTREHHSRIANVLRPAHPDQNYSQKCIPPSCPPPPRANPSSLPHMCSHHSRLQTNPTSGWYRSREILRNTGAP